MQMNRRDFSKMLALGLPFAGPAIKRRPPNFIVIVADDMGFSDIGCYGGEIQTPNINRLASEGVRFTQFYNCARCCPTRASLLTGLYNHNAGIGHMVDNMGTPAYQGYLNDSCVTFAETLKTAGYQTLMSGKWHVGETRPHWPTDRGFDHYYGLISGASSYFQLDPGRTMAIDDQPYVPPTDGFYMTDAITDNAIRMVHDAAAKPYPYLMYLAYTAPHWPLQAYTADIEKYRGHYREGWDVLRQRRYERQIAMGIIKPEWKLSPRYEKVPAWDTLSAKDKDDWDLRMAVYAAQIDRMDQNIGRFLTTLEKNHQLDNTIIFFLSDNGASAEEKIGKGAQANPEDPVPGGPKSFTSYRTPWANLSDTPFQMFKHYTDEGGIATPLIAWAPKYIARKNVLEHTPAHVMDLHPTLLRLAGASYPDRFKGHSIHRLAGEDFWPLVQGRKQRSTRQFYWEHAGNRALRDGDWKIVSRFKEPWALYNMASDRTEVNDLAAQEPERLHRMAAQWQQWADRTGVLPWEAIRSKKGLSLD